MTPAAGWHPVALAADIAPGTSAGTRLFGREFAVWRAGTGAVHVWEDRCPHRGMRLSFGFVRGDRLSCLYHGWQFDGEGRCRFIPAHPALEVPASITAARFPAIERGGVVWVFWGEGAPTEAPTAFDTLLHPVRSLSVQAAAARVAAALDAPGGAPSIMIARGEDRIVAALQPLAEGEACLHLLVAAVPDAACAAQLRVSAWAEALRRTLEAGGAA